MVSSTMNDSTERCVSPTETFTLPEKVSRTVTLSNAIVDRSIAATVFLLRGLNSSCSGSPGLLLNLSALFMYIRAIAVNKRIATKKTQDRAGSNCMVFMKR